ncbi:MAG TPA: hypothetical protein VM144_09000 [Aestuariivirga sp.]|nr:hypothetical protein [Aestuariivirga sp.]
MTNTHKFSAAAAFGAAALFSMLSFGSNAEAASVLNCKGASATKVASCCEKVVEENGRRPLWMVQNRMNCHDTAIIKCDGRQCHVRIVLRDGEGGDEKTDGGDRGGSPNDPR